VIRASPARDCLCLGYHERGRISILAVERPDKNTRKVTFICYGRTGR
jgi:hypothetical protein